MLDNSEIASSLNRGIIFCCLNIIINFLIDNAITIKPWYSDENDQELLRHMKILHEICNEGGDVRNIIKKYNTTYLQKDQQCQPNRLR